MLSQIVRGLVSASVVTCEDTRGSGKRRQQRQSLALVLMLGCLAMAGTAVGQGGTVVLMDASKFPGGSTTGNSFPMNTTSRGYGAVWTAAQMENRAGQIKEFGWQFQGVVNRTFTNVKYWMGETINTTPNTTATFASNFNAPGAAPPVLVYDGPMTITTTAALEFVRTVLTTPYTYSGQNSLFIHVEAIGQSGTGASHNNYSGMSPALPIFRLFEGGSTPPATIPTGSSTNYSSGASFVIEEAVTKEILSGTTEVTGPVGSSGQGYPFNRYWHDQLYQAVYLKTELQAAGISAGAKSIKKISFKPAEIDAAGVVEVRIRMKNFSGSSLTARETTGLQLVYGPVTLPASAFTVNNYYTFTLSTPFIWNGNDNLLVEFSQDGTAYTNGGSVYLRQTTGTRSFRLYSDSLAGPFPFETGSPSQGLLSDGVPSMELTYQDLGAPLITTATLPDAYEGTAYSQAISAIGGGGGPYAWSITAGNLPGGLTLNPSTGVISGTPNAATSSATPYAFTVKAEDAAGSGTANLSITVPALSFVTPPGALPPCLAGVSYSQSIPAAGGGATKTYIISAGALPNGITLNTSTGVISGTAAGSAIGGSPYTFTVTVSDGNGLISGQFTLEVKPPFMEFGTGTLNAASSTPLYRSSSSSSFDYSLQTVLYTTAELSAIPAGSEITRISFNKTSAFGSTDSTNKLRIYAGNSTATSLTASTTFGAAKTGKVLVFENTSYFMPVAAGWVDLPFNTSNSFVYTGGSIEFLVEWDCSVAATPSTGAFNWRYDAVTNRGQGYSSSTAYTDATSMAVSTNGGNSRLPHIQIEFSPPAPFDADPQSMLFSGAVIPRVGSNDISVAVKNNGTNTLVGATLNLEYVVNGGTPVAQAFVGGAGLTPGGTETFTFTTPWVIGAPGNYSIDVRFTSQLSGDPNSPAQDTISYTVAPDLDLTLVNTGAADPIVGSNTVNVTLKNSGTLSLVGVPLSLQYSTNGGTTWVSGSVTPSTGQLDTTNGTLVYAFTTPWNVLIPGPATLMARVNPQVTGDPDASDETSTAYAAIGFDIFTYQVGTLTGTSRQPVYRLSSTSTTDFMRCQMLYTPAELAALPALTKIGAVQFYKTNAGATTGPGARMKVWLQNTSETVYTASATWSSIIASATLFYSDDNFTMPADIGWITVGSNNQGTPFFYTGGSLAVYIEWDCNPVAGNPTTDAFSWQYTSRTGSTANSLIRQYIASTTPTVDTTLTLSSSTQYGSIQNMRLLHKVPAANDIDVLSVDTADGMVGLGNNTVKVTVENAGTASQNGSLAIQYSIDGTNWVNETFTAASLGSLLATETFTFTAPLVLANTNPVTLRARLVTPLSGDPDPVAGDTASKSFALDADILSVSQFPGSIPRLGSNTPRITVINNGSFRLTGVTLNLSYAVGGGTPVAQSFVAAGLATTSSTEVFSFTTAWNLATVTPLLSFDAAISPVVTGDVDATDAVALTYTDAGVLIQQVGDPNAPEIAANNSGYLFNSYYHDQRMQVLIPASDLAAAGFRIGTPLSKVQVKPSALPGFDTASQQFRHVDNLRVRMQHTAATNGADPFVDTGWSDLFGPTTVLRTELTVGNWFTIPFATPFIWDGVSNVYIDFSSDGTFYSDSPTDGGLFMRATPEVRTRRMYIDGSAFPWTGVGTQATTSESPVMRFEFALPPDTDLDIASLSVNAGAAVTGNNQVKVAVFNAGLLSRTGQAFQLQYSTDGTTWVSENFTPTALADLQTEVFTFVTPLNISAYGNVNLQARIFPALTGDPDASDTASLAIGNDIDLLSAEAGAGNPALGANSISFTLKNNGQFDAGTQSISVTYRVDAGANTGTPVTEIFQLGQIALPGSQNSFSFVAPWNITQNRTYTLTVTLGSVPGDTDMNESVSVRYAVNVPFREYNGGGTLSSTSAFPIQRSTTTTSDFSYTTRIYTADMLGLPPGAEITSLSFYKNDTTSTLGTGTKLRVWLRNTDREWYSATESTTYTYESFFGLTSTMTRVFETDNFEFTGVAGWLEFGPFNGTPFIYTGGSLEIAVDCDFSLVNNGAGNPTTSSIAWRGESFTAPTVMYRGLGTLTSVAPSPTSTLGLGGGAGTSNQPHMRVEYFAENPAFADLYLPAAEAGVPYAFTLTGRGGAETGFTYGVSTTGDALPAGLSLNPVTGEISGTPAAGTQGIYNVTFTNADAFSTGSRTYRFTVAAFADDFSADRGWTFDSLNASYLTMWSRSNSWGLISGTRPAAGQDHSLSADGFVMGVNNPITTAFPASMTDLTYAVSPAFDLTGYANATLSWSEFAYITILTNVLDNVRTVELSTDNGASWTVVRGRKHIVTNAWHRYWQDYSLDISQAAGFSQVKVRFGYRNTSATTTTQWGMMIDDVVVSGEKGFRFKTPTTLGAIGQGQNRIQPGALKIETVNAPSGTPAYSVTAGNLPPGMILLPSGEFFGDSTTQGFYTFTVAAQSGVTTITREFTLEIAQPGVLWGDGFATNRGWTTEGQWERAPARQTEGREPGIDTSAGNDNMIMGTVVGGYYTGTTTSVVEYITSPELNLTLAAPLTLVYSEWEYITTPSTRTVEVWDGNTWQVVSSVITGATGSLNYIWNQRTINVTSQVGNKPVSRIRFGFVYTSTVTTYNGRYIDDVALFGEFAEPLDITTTSLPSATEGAPYTATLQKTGGVTGVIGWEIDSNSLHVLPTGLSLNTATGVISGTPAINGGSYGTYTITFNALSAPLSPDTVTLTLVVDLEPIVITNAALPTGQETEPYTAQLAATGGLGSGYVWTVSSGSLPNGIGLNPNTGELTGTPAANGGSFGTYNVTFQASSGGITATKQLTITISLVPLVVTTTSLPNAIELTAYSAALSATGGTSQWAFSLAATSGPLPAGLGFSLDGRSITGTPAFLTKGTYVLNLEAFDGVLTTPATLTLTVDYRALAIDTVALASGVEGSPYSQQLTASGGSGNYVFALTGGTMPSGLSLSPSGVLSGTPAINGASYGTRTLTFAVTDSVATGLAAASVSRTLTIALSAVVVTTSSLPNGQEESPYTASLAATGGTGTFTWSVSSGSLPTGLSLSSAGVISGTPGSRGTAAGTHVITFMANDGVQTPGTNAVLSLTIGFKPMTITTTALASGVEGTAYSATLAGDGGGVTYSWGLAAGSNPLPSGLSVVAATGEITGTPAINNASAGTHLVTFQLSDNQSTPATKQLSITIALRPFVLVTQSFPPGLEGDPYSQTIQVTGGTGTYNFTIVGGTLPVGLSLNASTGEISGTPPTGTSGLRNFTFRVTDGASPHLQLVTSIEIFPPFLQFATTTLPNAVENTTYNQQVLGVGGFGTYSWSIDASSQHQLPPGLSLTTTVFGGKVAAVISGTLSGPGVSAGTYNVTLRLTDSLGAFVTQLFTITISHAPLVVNTPNPPVATIGQAYSQSLGVGGGTGNYTVTYAPGSAAAPPGMAINSTTGFLFGSPTVDPNSNAYNSAGLATYTFTIRVSDGISVVTQAITATVQIQPLAITTSSLASGTEGTAYSVTLAGSGGQGNYVWAMAPGSSLPNGLSLSTGGVLSGTPALNGQSYGSHSVTFRLSDGGLAPADRTLTLTIALKPMSITSTSLATATVGTAYSEALAATGGTGNYSWSVATSSPAQLPTGLSLSTAGVISGTAATGTHGTRTITFRLSDGVLTAVTKSLSLVVSPAPLAVTTATLPNGTEGTAYTATLAATGGTGTFLWSLAPGSTALPSGLTLSSSGVISGTPAINNQSAGTRNITVRVADGVLTPANQQLSITIALRPLVIGTAALSNATVGTSYSASLSATGGAGSFTWSVASGSASQMPAGLSLNATTGAITGTPAVGSHATYSITFEVADGATVPNVTKTLSLTVVPATLTITTTSLPTATEGAAYSTTLAASGGGGAHTWALTATSAPLPSGLTLSPSGVLSGTPAGSGGSHGSYTVSVQVTDALSTTVSAALALTVSLPTLQITTTSLPSGVEGTVYSATLAATGGTGTYTWSLAAGSPALPTGLTLSAAGAISGTPAINNLSAGTRNLVFSVTNGIQTPVTATLTLTIALRPLVISTTTLPNGTEGQGYLSQLVATGGTGSFSWSVAASSSLPTGLAINAGSGIISGTPAPNGASYGTRQIAFVVSDGNSQTTATITMTINLSAIVVSTTTVANGTEGTAYSAQLAATGGTGTYTWSLSGTSQPLPSGLALSSSGIISGTPATGGASAGQRNLTVLVNDGVQAAATATVSITILLQPIQITTASVPGATEGSSYSAQLAATGGTGTFAWALNTGSPALPAGLTLSAAGLISGTPNGSGATAGTYNIVVRATSGTATPVTQSLSLVVSLQPLVITTTALANGTEGSPYSAPLAATGGTTARTWSLAPGSPALPQGLSISASTGTISGTPALNGASYGTRSLVLQVVSGPLTAVKGLSITIALTPVVISTAALPSGTEGTAYSANLVAAGGTGTYTWSLAAGSATMPSGLTLNPSAGTITGTPAINGASHGTRTLIVSANDGVQASVTANLQITIALRPVEITTVTLPGGTEGLAYSGSLAATGGTGTFTWSVSPAGPQLAPGLTLNAQTGAITGTPLGNGQSFGTRNVVFVANDGIQAPVSKAVSITIQLTAVSITTGFLPNGTEGGTYSQTLQATGGTGNYTWSVSPTGQQLPNGLSLSPSGVISGNLATGNQSAGTYTVVIQVTDGPQAPVTRSYTFSVSLVTLVINQITLPLGIIGQTYSAQLTASGGTGNYAWSVSASSPLAAGLTLNASTGAIGGSPAPGTAGNRQVTFELNDGVSILTASATLSVLAPATISTTSLPNARVGAVYQFALTAIGGQGTLVFGTAPEAPLPAGLTISPSGVISGTPAAAGIASVTFTVAGELTSSSKTLTLVTEAMLNRLPVVDAGPNRSLSHTEFSALATPRLAAVGLAGSAVDPDNDVLALAWTLVSGPNNGNLAVVSANAAITGLEVTGTGPAIIAGTYVFRLTATEASTNNTVSDTVQVLVVSPAVVPPAAHAGINQSVVAGTLVTLSGAESSDPDNPAGTLVYIWTVASQPAGASVSLDNAAAKFPKFTPTVAGVYEFQLVVRDEMDLTSAPASVQITVAPAQATQATLARAVANMTFVDTDASLALNTGEAVTLRGSAQYAGPAANLLYAWAQVSGPETVMFANPSAANQTFTAGAPGNYLFRLSVAVGTFAGIPADLAVTIAPTGFAPPVALASIATADDPNNDKTILFIPNVGVDGVATNPTIDLVATGSTEGVSYLWSQTAGPTAIVTGTNTPTLSVTPLLSRVYSFTLTVTDANNLTASSTITFAVDTFHPELNPGGNSVPQATAATSTGASESQTNVPLSLFGSVLDANAAANTNFIYLWVQVSGPPVVLNVTNPLAPTFTPTVPGIYVFELYIDDGADISLPSTVSVNVTNTPSAPTPGTGGTGTIGSSSCSLGTDGANLPLLMLLGALMAMAAVFRRRRREA